MCFPKDNEWEDIRDVYAEHMELLEELEGQVHQSLERLELETRTLREVCEGINQQKNSLREIVRRFSHKQSQYRDKGTSFTFTGLPLLIVFKCKRSWKKLMGSSHYMEQRILIWHGPDVQKPFLKAVESHCTMFPKINKVFSFRKQPI